MQTLEQLCRDHGFRITRQRLAVLEVLEVATDRPCAFEIQRRIMEEKHIGIATVYRVLKMLREVGLVKRVGLEVRNTHYERIGRPSHPLLVDVASDKIVEVQDVGLVPLFEKQARRMGFQLANYRLTLFGMPIEKDP